MGAGIAQVAASAGHTTILYDASPETLERSRKTLEKVLAVLVEKGKIQSGQAESIKSAVKYAGGMQEFKDCGLVIEAIIEDLEVKQKVFRELETIVDANCILATNTSSLSVTSIASSCKKPGRVIGIHFFNPAFLMPLVEIIPAISTEAGTLKTVRTLIDSWKKTTVLAKDTPGFIVNRLARSYYGESIRIYEEGMADFATIDWAMKEFGAFRMGPFELMDFIGNDINYKVTETVWEQFFYEPRFKPSFTQKRLFEAGYFGRKTGRGYYDYSNGVVMPEPVRDETLGKSIFKRVLAMLINEAADSLYLGLASREDLDMAVTKGVNYPKGLLAWADDIGVSKVYDTLQELYEEYGEDRYRPCVLLKRMAKTGGAFYEKQFQA
jgi:3-hydroxybutyryl-CoA dehydrogenase